MISEETADQIVKRNRMLGKINFCLENLDILVSSELELSFYVENHPDKRTVETLTFCNKDVEELLGKLKAYHEERIKELNAKAIEEAQG
ncbi:MAG: hypothetical protein LBH43_15650 [Treponema sp.]|nr:hypothetical protein [Treponema sp.]